MTLIAARGLKESSARRWPRPTLCFSSPMSRLVPRNQRIARCAADHVQSYGNSALCHAVLLARRLPHLASSVGIHCGDAKTDDQVRPGGEGIGGHQFRRDEPSLRKAEGVETRRAAPKPSPEGMAKGQSRPRTPAGGGKSRSGMKPGVACSNHAGDATFGHYLVPRRHGQTTATFRSKPRQAHIPQRALQQ